MKELKEWIKQRVLEESKNYHSGKLLTSYDSVSYGAYMAAYNAILEKIEKKDRNRSLNENNILNAREALNLLTDKERYDLIHEYCVHCGSKDPGCVCWKDE